MAENGNGKVSMAMVVSIAGLLMVMAGAGGALLMWAAGQMLDPFRDRMNENADDIDVIRETANALAERQAFDEGYRAGRGAVP